METITSAIDAPPPLAFTRDRWMAAGWWAGLVLNLACWEAVRRFIPYRIDPVNLHYTIYFGIDRIGSWWQVWMVPLSSLGVLILNTAVCFLLYKKDPVLARVIVVASVFFQIFACFSVLSLIRINLLP